MKKLCIFLFLLNASVLRAQTPDWRVDIINKAQEIYAPIALSELKKPLLIKVIQNNSIAASADYDYNFVKVEIYSGLLNAPKLTPDVLRMTICHELGHLFGGEPKKNIPPEWEGLIDENGMSYLSAEGQADYYSSATCFRKLDSEASVERISEAGLRFLNLVFEFPISISTPDLSVTPVLIRDSYPSRQCRLDTIIIGAKNLPRPACWFRP